MFYLRALFRGIACVFSAFMFGFLGWFFMDLEKQLLSYASFGLSAIFLYTLLMNQHDAEGAH